LVVSRLPKPKLLFIIPVTLLHYLLNTFYLGVIIDAIDAEMRQVAPGSSYYLLMIPWLLSLPVWFVFPAAGGLVAMAGLKGNIIIASNSVLYSIFVWYLYHWIRLRYGKKDA